MVIRFCGVAWKIPHRVNVSPGPLGIAKVDRWPVNKLIRQTSGGTEGMPTVVNKRKYLASSTSASLSTSSSGSSSTPSSPTSEVDREGSIPGGRSMVYRLPRPSQMVKRPRLYLTPPGGGGGVTAPPVQARQTFAPPPVFRSRPPTPFNRPPGETGVNGDQGEGSGYVEVEVGGDDVVEVGENSPELSPDLSSDISLDLRPHRRR